MGEAVLFSLIASSALVIGGVLGAYWHGGETLSWRRKTGGIG